MIKAFCIKCGYYIASEINISGLERCEHSSNRETRKDPDTYLKEGKVHSVYVSSPSEINSLNNCPNYIDVTKELPDV